MKAIFAAALFFTVNASAAQASYLPSVSNVRISVVGGGGIAAVQPYTTITVTINSCGEKQLTVDTIKEADGTVSIKLIDPTDVDCMAVGKDRDYTLQVSSDATGEKYVLLNPIKPTVVR